MILDGKKVQKDRKDKLSKRVKESRSVPTLAIIQVGNNSSSNIYIQQKKNFGESLGIRVLHTKLSEDISFEEISLAINSFNKDSSVHGIIVQLPLPEHLDSQQVIDLINPQKDVDGLTTKQDRIVPATARGIKTLLDSYGFTVKDKKVTVVGRSKLVGSPTAKLMEKEGANITVCHRETEDVPSKCREADILIVAAGHPGLITKDYVKEGQVVIDVGINAMDNKRMVGDVDFDGVSQIVSAISPVPGGVGPMTVLSLFENLLDACNN